MKNFIWILVAITLMSFTIGMVIIAEAGGIELMDKVSVSETYAESPEGVDTILVHGSSESIVVKPSPDDMIHYSVSGKSSYDGTLGKVDNTAATDGLLEFSIEEPTQFLFVDFINDLQQIVEIPKSYQGTITLATVSGFIEVSDLNNVKLGVETTSGAIRVLDCTGSIAAESTSGGIYIKVQELLGDIRVQNTSGRVSLVLPESVKAQMDFNSTSGSLKNESSFDIEKTGKNTYQSVDSDGPYMVLVKTVSGGMKISNNGSYK